MATLNVENFPDAFHKNLRAQAERLQPQAKRWQRSGPREVTWLRTSMKRVIGGLWVAVLAGMALGTGSSAAAAAPAPDAIVVAVRRGDCSKAVQELIAEVNANQSQTALFVGGRMLDEGICMKRDPLAAAKLFERSAEMGDTNAALDYAAKIGLGEGTEQDYQLAGDACHKAGIDPKGQNSFYSLGYACTVRGVAGRLLRETLPKDAFHLPTTPAIVEFQPNTSEIHIRSAPEAVRGEAPTGTWTRVPVVDTRRVIEKAWRDALAAVPKPDAARLGAEVVSLPIDLDTTLEAGRNAPPDATAAGRLLQGDIFTNRPAGSGH